LPATTLNDTATVRSYKSLALVERAFRCIKTVDLQVRPVHHWLADPVRAHVFLCMLGYYLEWHMRQRLAPMLFDDTEKDAAEALRASVQTTSLTEDGFPVHSFRSLLADLATLARNTITTAIIPAYPLIVLDQADAAPAEGFRSPRRRMYPVKLGISKGLFCSVNSLRAWTPHLQRTCQ
jgi:hypothetical protein